LGITEGREIPVDPRIGDTRTPPWFMPTSIDPTETCVRDPRSAFGETKFVPGEAQAYAVPPETVFEKSGGTTIPAGRGSDPAGTVPEKPGLLAA
jgi:hypothetical protein